MGGNKERVIVSGNRQFVSKGPERDGEPKNVKKVTQVPTSTQVQNLKRGRGRPRSMGLSNANSSKHSENMSSKKPLMVSRKRKRPYKIRPLLSGWSKKITSSQESSSDEGVAKNCRPGTSAAAKKRLNKTLPEADSAEPSLSPKSRFGKPEYKEIILPSFRIREYEPLVDEELLQKQKEAGHKRCNPKFFRYRDRDSNNEIEDLSDEKYKLMHSICEEEEKRKFTNYGRMGSRLQSRSRQNILKSDTLAEKCVRKGIQVSPTYSPSISHNDRNNENDLQGVSSYKSTLTKKGSNSNGTPRSTSASSPPKGNEDVSGEPVIASWPARNFPLSQKEYEQMLKENTN